MYLTRGKPLGAVKKWNQETKGIYSARRGWKGGVVEGGWSGSVVAASEFNSEDPGFDRSRDKSWVAPYYGCSLSPGESSPNFPCIAQDKKVI